MAEPDGDARPRPPSAGSELESLIGFLELQRATFSWKCSGLDRAGMAARLAPSTMTLGGMMKHLALVEDWWCSVWLWDREFTERWRAVDWDADPDWEWRTAADDSPEEVRAIWDEAVQASRASVAEALEVAGLDTLALRSGDDGLRPSLRWILLHLIEEYARHLGHADLLRESIDGLRGE